MERPPGGIRGVIQTKTAGIVGLCDSPTRGIHIHNNQVGMIGIVVNTPNDKDNVESDTHNITYTSNA